MRPPRGLSEEEMRAWEKLAATVTPLTSGVQARRAPEPVVHKTRPDPAPKQAAPILPQPPVVPPARPQYGSDAGLDSHWERRLRGGTLVPDFTLDLHDHSLDAAYHRLMDGLDLARETGARIVLIIAGRERGAPAADRGNSRGAIRSKLLDWLAASRHASSIAAIRNAHRRHGGEGALYVILRRR